MHLISALVAGVRGCEGGTAEIRKRGTPSFATYYTSFEADGATVPTAGIALDGNGGAEVYVNELVDVTCKDASGNTIRLFTAGEAAPAIEAITQSFTGTSYSDGSTGASKPTTAQAVFDLWKTQNGAIDWQVAVGSTTKTIAKWLSGMPGYYNVKDTTYGAKGDGATDDTSAIQAAITAANAGGGGVVFFPPGTYKTTSALTLSDKVNLLGSGCFASRIQLAHATANAITIPSLTDEIYIRDLGIAPSQANSGSLITAAGGSLITISGCHIGDTVNTNGKCVALTGGSPFAVIYGCLLEGGAGAGIVNTTGTVMAALNWIRPPTAGSTIFSCSGGQFLGNQIQTSRCTSGNTTIFSFTDTSTGATLVGNFAGDSGGGLIFPWNITAGQKGFFESGNSWGSNGFTWTAGVAWSVTAAASSHEGNFSASRSGRRYYTQDDTAAVTLPIDNYATCEISRTTNGAQTVNFNAPPCAGLVGTLVYDNNQGAVSGTITMGTNVKGVASFTVNANLVSTYLLVSIERGTSKFWLMVLLAANHART